MTTDSLRKCEPDAPRTALAQLSTDVRTLLDAWEERVDLLRRAERSMGAVARIEAMAARQEITRCRGELQAALARVGRAL